MIPRSNTLLYNLRQRFRPTVQSTSVPRLLRSRSHPHRQATQSNNRHRQATRSNNHHRQATRSNNRHRQATRSNNRQRQATRSNNRHRQATRSNNRHRQATRSNNRHRQATRSNNRHRQATRSNTHHHGYATRSTSTTYIGRYTTQPTCPDQSDTTLPASSESDLNDNTSPVSPDQNDTTSSASPDSDQSDNTSPTSPDSDQSDNTSPTSQESDQSDNTLPASQESDQSDNTSPASQESDQSDNTSPASQESDQSDSTSQESREEMSTIISETMDFVENHRQMLQTLVLRIVMPDLTGDMIYDTHGAEREVVEQLTVRYKYFKVKMDAGADPDICTVCFVEMKSGQNARRLGCMHLFHVDCIDPWLERNTACPVCRTDITAINKITRKSQRNIA